LVTQDHAPVVSNLMCTVQNTVGMALENQFMADPMGLKRVQCVCEPAGLPLSRTATSDNLQARLMGMKRRTTGLTPQVAPCLLCWRRQGHGMSRRWV
jgi:hypothetical protein